jgi:hypothetical protein
MPVSGMPVLQVSRDTIFAFLEYINGFAPTSTLDDMLSQAFNI